MYVGQCPDLITGIHGNGPIALYEELREAVQEVIDHFGAEGRPLPEPMTRPMREVV